MDSHAGTDRAPAPHADRDADPDVDAFADNPTRRPIFVAIGGDSGSGKSTLAAGFYRIFGNQRITTICLDDYHSLDRRQRGLVGFTALDPRANNFAAMEEQLLALKRGQVIQKPVYDHRDGTFGPPEATRAEEVVIVQGLHPFLVPGIRALFDLKVWLDPDEDLKHHWKIQRDVAKRGYSEAQVRAEIEHRRADVDAFIEPQKRFADLLVRFHPGAAPEQEHLGVTITTRPTLTRLDLNGVLQPTLPAGLRVSGTGVGGDEVVEIDGSIDRSTVRALEDRIWEHMDARHHHLRHLAPDQFGTFTDARLSEHHSDPLALTQLLLVQRILSARKWMLLKVPLLVHEALVQDRGPGAPVPEGIEYHHELP